MQLTTQYAPLAKKEFKRLHSGGELLLLQSVPWELKATAKKLDAKLAQGECLADYAVNTTRADIDGKNTHIHYNESEGIVLAVTDGYIHDNGFHYPPQTVIYIIG